MLPFHLEVFGLYLAAWDAVFLVAVVAGYGVLRFTVALPGVDPAVTAIPGYRLLLGYLVTVYVTALGAGLDLWTPPVLAVLAIVRAGCFLQGCCYGVVSHTFGLRFPESSIAYNAQVASGLIARGGAMLPVVPAQLAEAVFLLGLLLWSLRTLRAGRAGVFVPAMVAYSTFRFAIEFVRADPVRNSLGPFSTSQWVALGVIAAAALVRYADGAPREVASLAR